MNKKSTILSVIISAIIITILFHKQALGVNLFLFESLLMVWLIGNKQFQLKGNRNIIYGLSVIATSVFTILTHSIYSYLIHFLVLFIFIGVLIYPQAKSLLTSFGLSFINFFNTQAQFFMALLNAEYKDQKFGKHIWKSRIFVIPILVIIIFIAIYRNSNPVFNDLVVSIINPIQNSLNIIFEDFDGVIIWTFIIGIILSNFLLLRSSEKELIDADQDSSDVLLNDDENNSSESILRILKNENKAGIFLFLMLNVILLILNVMDIKWVWFNFEWEGQYLKSFVHEGTYLLILSILISMALVLFFFRSKLNFYKNNGLLKALSYIWLAQNAILIISVAIRNTLYISYFSLAYKRIGVFVFLLLTIYGLISVFIKVKDQKSAFYLLRTNAFAAFLVLVCSAMFNWDVIIAKYNFKNADQSFLHLDFLSGLSDKTLPELDKSLTELNKINQIQEDKFPFEVEYMKPEAYHLLIQERKADFKSKWEAKGILSWNLAEYLAYQKLRE